MSATFEDANVLGPPFCLSRETDSSPWSYIHDGNSVILTWYWRFEHSWMLGSQLVSFINVFFFIYKYALVFTRSFTILAIRGAYMPLLHSSSKGNLQRKLHEADKSHFLSHFSTWRSCDTRNFKRDVTCYAAMSWRNSKFQYSSGDVQQFLFLIRSASFDTKMNFCATTNNH